MGTGWRKAFCTTIPRSKENAIVIDDEEDVTEVKSSRSYLGRSKSGLSTGNKPPTATTPRLQTCNSSPNLFCNTTNDDNGSSGNKKLRCKTAANTPKSTTSSTRSPRTILLGSNSNPSSPRSPFSLLKNTLRLSKNNNNNNNCGVCMQSVKAGQGMAIYTAECSHAFHFPCILDFLNKQTTTTLLCPICKSPWKDVPFLTTTTTPRNQQQQQQPKPKLDTNTDVSSRSPKMSYHDDEPLISPKFHPIPEEDDDDSEEFRGFFVNPTLERDNNNNNTNNGFKDCSEKEFRNVDIGLFPESAVIATGRTHETVAVMLKIKAPPAAEPSGAGTRRAPIDLVSVLDVSGGMDGAKLQMLKRAMRLVISSLGSADRLSIVAYAATPKRLMPLRRMNGSGQRLARRIIDHLECGSGTCANEALRNAAKILEHRRERNPVASIILLSGGQEDSVQVKNDNQQRKPGQSSTTTRFSHIEIPVHSSGVGEYTHVPEEDAFSKCVGGLLSVVVQDLRVQLSLGSGSSAAEILAVYSCSGKPAFLGTDFIRVGDLYAEEEKEFLVELRVPISTFGSRHVLSVRSSYKHAATQELVYNREHALSVPKPPQTLQGGNEQMRNIFISTRAIAESRRLIEQNELNRAMQLLSSARAFVLQSKFDSSKEHVNNLEAELAQVQWKMQCKQQQQQTLDQVKIVRKKINDQGASLFLDENGESLTPTSAWKAAEKLAKMAMMKKSFNRVGDLHGLENAGF